MYTKTHLTHKMNERIIYMNSNITRSNTLTRRRGPTVLHHGLKSSGLLLSCCGLKPSGLLLSYSGLKPYCHAVVEDGIPLAVST